MRKKKALKKRGLLKAAVYANFRSQYEFSQALKLNEQIVSQIITGRRKASREEMARMSQVLNTPMHLLFPEEGETP
ncbi:helix-turn-helix domain-containing protein [Thermodesulfobacteriota bacterium]